MIQFQTPWVLALYPVAAALLLVFLRMRWPRLASRLVLLLLLFLALARPEVSTSSRVQEAMIVLDRSSSVRLSSDELDTFAWIQQLVSTDEHVRFGLVEFGGRASIVSLPGSFSASLYPAEIPATPTRLLPAIEAALASFSNQGSGQIVLISDGSFTDDATAAIAAAQVAGVPIHVLPIGQRVAADLVLRDVDAPSEVNVGASVSLVVQIDAPRATSARLVVYRDTTLLTAEDIALVEGINQFSVTDTLDESGFFTYRVLIHSDSDPVSDNNTLSAAVRTTTQPSVLLVSAEETPIAAKLLDALSVSYEFSTQVPAIETLSQYSRLIVAGLPLDTLSTADADTVDQFVRNLGGGVLVVRGEESVQAFYDSTIDHLLPVSSTVPEIEEEPSLALVYVLDRSSSMRELVSGVAKIRILRDATAASVSLLPSSTLVGIIGFDDEHDWLLPISPAGDAVEIYGVLRNLRAYGGTDLYYPLLDAAEQLIEVAARSKHILLVSDGKTVAAARDYDSLYTMLRENEDITLSIIAPGTDLNLTLLEELVDAGSGTLYLVPEFDALPAAILDATQNLSRSRLVAEPTEVTGTFAEGLDIPAVESYVLTYPRSASQTYLWAGDDPLFATWNVGLGIVSVLNTDLSGVGTSSWTSWSGLAGLFAEFLSATEPASVSAEGLYVNVTVAADDVDVLVDARTSDGIFANGLDISADLLPAQQTAAFEQVGPGLYHATFELPAVGGYALRVADATMGRSVTAPVTVSYSPEYLNAGLTLDVLTGIAGATGGEVLSDTEPDLPSGAATARRRYVAIHRYLLYAALALLFVELVVHRWPRRWVPLG